MASLFVLKTGPWHCCHSPVCKNELAFLLSDTRTARLVFGFLIALAALIALLLVLIFSVLVCVLIGLTGPFRTLSAFSILRHSFSPLIVNNRYGTEPRRVPSCSPSIDAWWTCLCEVSRLQHH